jgi:hypothetical protein
LLVKGHKDNTDWMVAAKVGNTEMRQELGECARRKKSLRWKVYFVSHARKGTEAYQVAIERQKTEVLDKLTERIKRE